MRANWTYRDLFDLEYCLHLDRDDVQDELHKRDRGIYNEFESVLTNGDQRNLLYVWLQARKRQLFDNGLQSPGTLVSSSLRSAYFFLVVIGLFSGIGAGLSFFTYSGETPVNVLHFLFIFIFSQLFLMLLLFFSLALRSVGLIQPPSAITQIYSSLVGFFSKRSSSRLLKHLSSKNRLAYEQAFGLLRQTGKSYGNIWYWPFFLMSQAVMILFNTGLLAATLFRVVTSDLAFGWQSTIQFSASFIHQVVTVLALPWSWLVPIQYAYPSLTEIEGSRIILKDGIYHLATQDLISWWPFLVFCLICYGIILRLLFVAAGRFLQHRTLRTIKLNSSGAFAVIQRMLTPRVRSQARRDDSPGGSEGLDLSGTAPNIPPSAVGFFLLLPEDMTGQAALDEIVSSLRRQGLNVYEHEIIRQDYEADRAMLEKLGHAEMKSHDGYLMLAEAWMPPINDTLTFLRDLRNTVGSETPIFIALSGRSGDGKLLARPARIDSRVWHRKIDGLGDPHLSVVDLGDSGSPDSEVVHDEH